ncbi:hypothetical protein, partial [Vibrio anguillarum]
SSIWCSHLMCISNAASISTKAFPDAESVYSIADSAISIAFKSLTSCCSSNIDLATLSIRGKSLVY